MTAEDAKAWVSDRFGAAAVDRLQCLADLVVAENKRQNLIAPSTEATIWTRHLVDSAQLLPLGVETGRWIDVGTGGGFPGMVIALLRSAETVLVEPRRRRAEFLSALIDQFHLPQCSVIGSRVETLTLGATVISARAVASLAELFRGASRCADAETIWLLPRGQGTADQLAHARHQWRGTFHVKQSLTDSSSGIVIATGVRPA